jgi:hypothetical protein
LQPWVSSEEVKRSDLDRHDFSPINDLRCGSLLELLTEYQPTSTIIDSAVQRGGATVKQ